MSADPRIVRTEAELLEIINAPAWDKTQSWAYVRVSGAKQQRDGLGLEGQVDAIVEYCAKQKLPVPLIISEVGSAGKPMLNIQLPGASIVEGEGREARPLLTMLLAALYERGRGRMLTFWKLDRFSRAGEEQEILLRLLWRAGVVIHSTDTGEAQMLSGEGLDPSRALLRQVLSAVASFERHLITTRMAMGRRAKAARGGYIHSNPPPGYVIIKRDLAVDPSQVTLVAATHYLRSLDFAIRPIADELSRRFGIARITHTRVHRILQNRTLHEGLYVDPFGGRHERPELRIIPGDWDAWAAEHDPFYSLTKA